MSCTSRGSPIGRGAISSSVPSSHLSPISLASALLGSLHPHSKDRHHQQAAKPLLLCFYFKSEHVGSASTSAQGIGKGAGEHRGAAAKVTRAQALPDTHCKAAACCVALSSLPPGCEPPVLLPCCSHVPPLCYQRVEKVCSAAESHLEGVAAQTGRGDKLLPHSWVGFMSICPICMQLMGQMLPAGPRCGQSICSLLWVPCS